MTKGLEGWTPDRATDAALASPIIDAERAALAILLPALLERTDAFDDAEDSISSMMAALRRLLSASAVAKLLASVGASVRRRSSGAWARAWKRATGLELPPAVVRAERAIVTRWVTENVARISTLATTARTKTEDAIRLAIRDGRSPEALAAELERVGLPVRNGRLRGRGTVIARDQLSTLAGDLAERQQTGAGITHYIWRTVRDSKVRDTHASREGKRFAWDSPPSGGHPGQAINCRCSPEAVVDLDKLPRRVRS